MGETANTIPPKGLGSVNFWKDLGKGAFLAALTNILLALYTIVQSGNMPTNEQWREMALSTFAILLSYFIKNLSTNNVGELFTKDKPTTTVPAKELEQVIDRATDKASG